MSDLIILCNASPLEMTVVIGEKSDMFVSEILDLVNHNSCQL
jgi:hypothetical protein